MYDMLGVRRIEALPSVVFWDFTSVDGGRARGRLADSFEAEEVLLVERSESVRRCESRSTGIAGRLLLVGREGRPSPETRLSWATSAGVVCALNLDEGGGLAPDGRAGRDERRSDR